MIPSRTAVGTPLRAGPCTPAERRF